MDQRTVDFIIVGAGSAGAALANRLTENGRLRIVSSCCPALPCYSSYRAATPSQREYQAQDYGGASDG
jgi:glycine/D-amino acid oxidase-like deaminating enzyme